MRTLHKRSFRHTVCGMPLQSYPKLPPLTTLAWANVTCENCLQTLSEISEEPNNTICDTPLTRFTKRFPKATIADMATMLEKMEGAIRWALGEKDSFPLRGWEHGPYWWRSELRERSGLKHLEEPMTEEFYKKIQKAAKYIKNGTPLKDALDASEIDEAILLLSKLLKDMNK